MEVTISENQTNKENQSPIRFDFQKKHEDFKPCDTDDNAFISLKFFGLLFKMHFLISAENKI